jgi:hypothetical protein
MQAAARRPISRHEWNTSTVKRQNGLSAQYVVKMNKSILFSNQKLTNFLTMTAHSHTYNISFMYFVNSTEGNNSHVLNLKNQVATVKEYVLRIS